MARNKSENRRKPAAQPKVQDYRLPAEWEPHESTWVAWPHRHSDWPGKFPTIPWVYGEIIRWLHRHEPVNIIVNDEKSENQAAEVLARAGADFKQISFRRWPTDRVWTRDYGPIFLIGPDHNKALLDWRFNGWAKYKDWKKDDAVPARIAELIGCHSWRPMHKGKRLVLEGGSIDVNGQGLLLTTEECLLSEIQARNPNLTREELEHVFAEYLGIKKVLWLGRGIAGDDTHGHIDDLARFVGVRTVVAVIEANESDENWEPLRDNLRRLHEMTDLEGRPLEIVPLPMPAPIYHDGQRLPASYANFYIANGLVLVPTFNDPNDRIAVGTIADLFPGGTVVGIHAVDLVWGLGTLHCLTQQEPAAYATDSNS